MTPEEYAVIQRDRPELNLPLPSELFQGWVVGEEFRTITPSQFIAARAYALLLRDGKTGARTSGKFRYV